MEKRELEMRYLPATIEARAEGDAGIIAGRPIVYDSRTDIGYFDEIIERGALDGANISDVRLCLNHDTSYVYARARRGSGNNTMTITPNEYGLDFEARLAINDSPKAQDYYSAVQRQDMTGMSFMFSVSEDDWEDLDTDHPLRRIKKIASVVEISAVTFPAYEATSIYARSKDALESARAELESARQQRAKTPEGDASELELLKEKIKILGGLKQ